MKKTIFTLSILLSLTSFGQTCLSMRDYMGDWTTRVIKGIANPSFYNKSSGLLDSQQLKTGKWLFWIEHPEPIGKTGYNMECVFVNGQQEGPVTVITKGDTTMVGSMKSNKLYGISKVNLTYGFFDASSPTFNGTVENGSLLKGIGKLFYEDSVLAYQVEYDNSRVINFWIKNTNGEMVPVEGADLEKDVMTLYDPKGAAEIEVQRNRVEEEDKKALEEALRNEVVEEAVD